MFYFKQGAETQQRYRKFNVFGECAQPTQLTNHNPPSSGVLQEVDVLSQPVKNQDPQFTYWAPWNCQVFQETDSISQWVCKVWTNSIRAVSSRMLWPSCLAFRKTLATIVLHQYVRNLAVQTSLYNSTSPVLATLWLHSLLVSMDPQTSGKMYTSREGTQLSGNSCDPCLKPSMEVTGCNNQKSLTGTKFTEAECAHYQRHHSHKFTLVCGCQHSCLCDDLLEEKSIGDELESSSYSLSQSDEECENYKTDSCVSNDLVEFSDNAVEHHSSEHGNEFEDTTFLHTLHCCRTLCSEESELQDDSDLDFNNGIWNEGEVNQELANELLLRTFEEQALYPKPVSDKCFENRKCTMTMDSRCQECGRGHTCCICFDQEHGAGGTSRNTKAKRVRFKSNSKLVVVHHIIAWSFAYRAARRGPWEEYARDRHRFARRIERCASVLEPCLSRKISQYHSRRNCMHIVSDH